ncbi:MAG TPA: protein phosphatase 2C domain-containing protein, partial [Anaerolineaceae bacterium]
MQKFWNRLTGKKKEEPVRPVISDVKTAPLTADQLNAVSIQNSPKLQPPQLMVGIGQSIGKLRDHNEDSLFVLNATISGEKEGDPFGIFIIADGMGGHQHGEAASDAAARAMANYLVNKLDQPLFGLHPEVQSEPLQDILQAGVQEAQESVIRKAPGGGTTLTAALLVGEQVTFAHVGDSRAYLFFPDGRVQQATRDHSLVWRLQELGQITEEEAAVHPQRNVLYRAVGQGDPFEPDILTHPFPRPGWLMMCSDGLWGQVAEHEMLRIILSAPNPNTACQQLVAAANDAG